MSEQQEENPRAQRSDVIKKGPLMAAARAILRGMGLDDEDIAQPFTPRGGLLALVENGDRISIDLKTKTLQLDVDDAVLAERRAAHEPSDRSGKGYMVKAGYAQKYIASVGPASHGAITDSGNLHWPQEGKPGGGS
ncbi:MAG: dihydroxy-acid dehydratase [Candidatus Competibacteraceae bacterium]|jgi:dihydroxyacid dehydratase/phosphogluconate dehydratase|nr:dihydroxy-acid dehydratase [Candidatus Competibacteraceae bacterium]